MPTSGLCVAEKANRVEISYQGRTVCIARDRWPPAWEIDNLSPEISVGIVRWFNATGDRSPSSVTPIEIVLQMVFNYLRISDGAADGESQPCLAAERS